MEIPTRKWAQVTTNLVTDLLESNGFTTIAVFVDRMTKMVHFGPWYERGDSAGVH